MSDPTIDEARRALESAEREIARLTAALDVVFRATSMDYRGPLPTVSDLATVMREKMAAYHDSLADDADRLAADLARVTGERDAARVALAWQEERHGTEAEQEAEDEALREDLAAVDALSDDEVRRLNEAEGIDPPAKRQRFDTFLRVLTRETIAKAKLIDAEADRAELLQALRWALGEGKDPGSWPEGVEIPHQRTAHIVAALTAPTGTEDTAAVRRRYAARRILARVEAGKAGAAEKG